MPEALIEPHPELAPHLHPGEVVLWQARPGVDGLYTPEERGNRLLLDIGTTLVFLIGPAFAAGPVQRGLLIAIAFWVDAGLRIVRTRGQAAGTLHAITSQRLLAPRHGEIQIADTPEAVQVLDRWHGYGHVLWRRGIHGATLLRGRSAPDDVGFLAVPEPEAVADRLRAWLTERALPRLDRALDALAAARRGEDVGGRVATVGGPGVGYLKHEPADWPAEAPKILTFTEIIASPSTPIHLWKPIPEAEPGWRTLRVLGPDRSVMEITAEDRPLDTSFETERTSWRLAVKRAMIGTPVVGAEPELRYGPWRGFAVTHALQDRTIAGPSGGEGGGGHAGARGVARRRAAPRPHQAVGAARRARGVGGAGRRAADDAPGLTRARRRATRRG
ncbi:MAG: hypothetical protein ACK4PG_04825 [Acetobacteraceae bacterium]